LQKIIKREPALDISADSLNDDIPGLDGIRNNVVVEIAKTRAPDVANNRFDGGSVHDAHDKTLNNIDIKMNKVEIEVIEIGIVWYINGDAHLDARLLAGVVPPPVEDARSDDLDQLAAVVEVNLDTGSQSLIIGDDLDLDAAV
jgi:hypothetical protein